MVSRMFELVQHSYGKIFSRNVAFSFGIGEKFVFAYSGNTGALAGDQTGRRT